MGIKKSGKRLLRLGKEAARALGAGGKEWVEAVFQTAIKVIDEELNRSKAKPAPKARAAAPQAYAESARFPAKKPLKTPSKRPVKQSSKKQRVARRKSGVRAPGKPAAKPRRVSARPSSKSGPVKSPTEPTAPSSDGRETGAPLAAVPAEVGETIGSAS